MFDWLAEHKELLTWIGIGSAISFVASLVAVPILVARIPADYFAHRRPPALGWQRQHPLARFFLAGLKNGCGLVLIACGLAMLVLPGQGVLTIVLGLLLLDFPGKRALELWLVARPRIRRALDWIRARAGRPPLVVAPRRDDPAERD